MPCMFGLCQLKDVSDRSTTACNPGGLGDICFCKVWESNPDVLYKAHRCVKRRIVVQVWDAGQDSWHTLSPAVEHTKRKYATSTVLDGETGSCLGIRCSPPWELRALLARGCPRDQKRRLYIALLQWHNCGTKASQALVPLCLPAPNATIHLPSVVSGVDWLTCLLCCADCTVVGNGMSGSSDMM